MQNENITLSLEFGGFYQSIHEEVIEMNAGIYCLQHDCDLQECGDECQPDIDYAKTRINYCKAYLQKLEEYIQNEYEIGLILKFKELKSPREYNFSTDTIILDTGSFEQLGNLVKYLYKNEPDFAETLRDITIEKSGYYPCYNHNELMANKDNMLFKCALDFAANALNNNGEMPREFEICYDINN